MEYVVTNNVLVDYLARKYEIAIRHLRSCGISSIGEIKIENNEIIFDKDYDHDGYSYHAEFFMGNDSIVVLEEELKEEDNTFLDDNFLTENIIMLNNYNAYHLYFISNDHDFIRCYKNKSEVDSVYNSKIKLCKEYNFGLLNGKVEITNQLIGIFNQISDQKGFTYQKRKTR